MLAEVRKCELARGDALVPDVAGLVALEVATETLRDRRERNGVESAAGHGRRLVDVPERRHEGHLAVREQRRLGLGQREVRVAEVWLEAMVAVVALLLRVA